MQGKPRESGLLGSIVCCGSRDRDIVRHRDYCGFGVFPFEGKEEHVLSPIDQADSSFVFCVSDQYLVTVFSRLVTVIPIGTDYGQSATTSPNSAVIHGPWDVIDSFLPFVELPSQSSDGRVYVVGRSARSATTYHLCMLSNVSKMLVPIPSIYGPVTATVSTQDSQIILGHESGYISGWSEDCVMKCATNTSSSAIQSMSVDSDFLYLINTDKVLRVIRLEDFRHMDSAGTSVSPYVSLTMSQDLFPIRRIIVPWRKAIGGFPGKCVILLTTRGDLVRVDLDSVHESIIASGVSDATFGPFDNGPLIAVNHASVSAYQQGSYKLYSESENTLEGLELLDSIRETHGRNDPRLWTLCRRKCDRRLVVLSWTLRDSSRSN